MDVTSTNQSISIHISFLSGHDYCCLCLVILTPLIVMSPTPSFLFSFLVPCVLLFVVLFAQEKIKKKGYWVFFFFLIENAGRGDQCNYSPWE